MFQEFAEAVHQKWTEMCEQNHLFSVDVGADEMWCCYLGAFADGADPLYRKRSEHDCCCCRHFIRDIGNVVAIVDDEITTIWDVQVGGIYQPVADAMAALIRSRPIQSVWYTTRLMVGSQATFEFGEDVIEYHHFYAEVPSKFILPKDDIPTRRAFHMDNHHVFERSVCELSDDSVDTVLELISSNSLYRGEEWKTALGQLKRYKYAYRAISSEEKRKTFLWKASMAAGATVVRIRNHSIGVLLQDITSGVALDEAVRRYEAIVAPANYKRPKPVFSQRMLDAAREKLETMGYMASLPRRFAGLDDMTVNNILFADKDSAPRLAKENDVFASLSKDVTRSAHKFSGVQKIPMQQFVENVLPGASHVELYLEGRHARNLMSLTAPVHPEAPSMFKWDNAIGWAYAGNIADSDIRQNVKAAGGDVTGDLRFSIQWNDVAMNKDDLDAHCSEPGYEIYFARKTSPTTGGSLDVDIINPTSVPAVENIAWPTRSRMKPGTYEMFVYVFHHRGGEGGFRAEIEFDGTVYSYDYRGSLRTGQRIYVAAVTLDNLGRFTIEHHLEPSESNREMWNLSMNSFVPVSMVMYSPNYWNQQRGIGNCHVFFILNDCHNDEMPNGFYNEFLKSELLEYRHVMEALGGKLTLGNTDEQLSGVGFSSTQHNSVIVKVTGATERVLEVTI